MMENEMRVSFNRVLFLGKYEDCLEIIIPITTNDGRKVFSARSFVGISADSPTDIIQAKKQSAIKSAKAALARENASQ